MSAIRGFVDLVEEAQSMVDAGERADVVLEHLLAASGYLEELEESDDPQDETRVENLAELVAVAREFADEPVLGPSADPADETPATPGLSDFLERVALVADTDQIPDKVEGGVEQGVVTLMTLHTAKGLEFPVVFLTGLEDGVFPHQRSLGDQPELEEERRLAYVGVTRAQRRLYVSRAVVRSAWGAPSHNPPSRFIDELPVDLVDWRRTQEAQTSWNRPVLPSFTQRSTGAPTRRFGAAAARADASARGQKREVPDLHRRTRCTTTRSGWAPSSRSRAAATRRWPPSTSARRASSGCCCATPPSRSSDSPTRRELRAQPCRPGVSCGLGRAEPACAAGAGVPTGASCAGRASGRRARGRCGGASSTAGSRSRTRRSPSGARRRGRAA